MQNADFQTYKSTIRAAIRAALTQAAPGTLDEAGFPAYSHRNPLINWLFWQRLRVVMETVERAAPCPCGQILDFGCGSGVMLPFLGRHAQRQPVRDQRRRVAQHEKAIAGTNVKAKQETAKPVSAVQEEYLSRLPRRVK